MVQNMFDYYNMLKKNKLYIIYSGPLWADGIEGIAEALKRRLKFDKLPLSVFNAVFSVFIEQVNNMLMYSEDKDIFEEGNKNEALEDVSKGIFILGTKGKTYFLQSGNVMKSEQVNLVKNRIDYLNTLDKKGLREFYKQQMKEGNDNLESKGAGLGLIEIARRSSSKIEYEFKQMDHHLTFFEMYIEIG